MKLIELIEPKTEIIPVNRELPPDDSKRKHIKSKDELGSGLFSVARDNPKDPHTVLKHQRNTRRHNIQVQADELLTVDDGFSLYIEDIIENGLMDNPYFPRVYNIKKYVDHEGNIKHKWEIEKLYPLTVLSKKECLMLLDTILIDNEYKEDLEYLMNETADNSPYVLYGGITSALENEDIVKDESFNKAAEQIVAIQNEYNLTLDLTMGNIAFRRTQNGPQIVFYDPFGKVVGKKRT